MAKTQTMYHSVDSCILTMLDDGLSRLHSQMMMRSFGWQTSTGEPTYWCNKNIKRKKKIVCLGNIRLTRGYSMMLLLSLILLLLRCGGVNVLVQVSNDMSMSNRHESRASHTSSR